MAIRLVLSDWVTLVVCCVVIINVIKLNELAKTRDLIVWPFFACNKAIAVKILLIN